MSSHSRVMLVLVLLAIGFTTISFNLIEIQLVRHDYFLALADRSNERSQVTLPRRGNIYDSDGNILAQTLSLWEVRIDGRGVTQPDQQLPALAAALQLDPVKLRASFNPRNRYQLVASNVDSETLAHLRALKLNFLVYTEHDVRSYPNNELAAQLLGYLNAQGGQSGIEKEANTLLTGTPGIHWLVKDNNNNEIAGYSSSQRDLPAQDGANVTLTIKLTLQHVIEQQLDQIMQTYQPVAAHIILMQPETGEILALASRPTFDPNNSETFKPDCIRDRCLTDVVEPGSIFKIITIAGALNEGEATLDTPIFCENGSFGYAGKILHDDEPFGTLDLRHVLVHSSNIGCAKIAMAYLQDRRLHDYAAAFGIGQRTGLLQNQGESAGILRPVTDWRKISISRIPMGQEVAATPLQLVTAMAVIANGGHYVQPQVIAAISDADNHPITTFRPKIVRQVISERAAEEVTSALQGVVIEGTGKGAAVPGFSVAGKTGTAQKYIGGAYSHDRHVSSFLGFMPAQDPEFVALVMIDGAQTSHDYGGEISAPVFAAVAKQAAQILNIPPDQPVPGPILSANRPGEP